MTFEDQSVETIGERLRRLRLERGLSQRELSAPGVSYAYISRIEAGARRPSVKALRVLARPLGVSAEYLETGSDIHDIERRELRLADAELQLRLEGDPVAAARELDAVLDEAIAAGDVPAATRARLGLGYAAATRGEHAHATELLEQATSGGLISPVGRPDAYATLGRSWSALGQAERAVTLFERCLERVAEEAPDDDATWLRFASYLADALTDVGDFDRAQETLQAAAARDARSADPYARVRLYRSLGRAAGTAGRHQLSLAYLRRALGVLETTDDTLEVARAHLACGWVLIQSGQLDEADSQLARADALLGPARQQIDAVVLSRYRASLALRRGDADGAIAHARAALALAGDTLPDERGNAWFVVAEAEAMREATAAAEDAFAEAAQLLDEYGSPRDRAECYRAWGRLLRNAGREAEALDVLERAADFAADPRPHRAR